MIHQGVSRGLPQWIRSFLLLVATVAMCLAVLMVNRTPLYYFDTGSYFKQGDMALSLILPEDRQDGGDTLGAQNNQGTDAEADNKDNTTSGSRSMVYAVLVAAFWRANALGGIAFVNLAAILISSWLVARVARRLVATSHTTLPLMTIPLLAGATTALPFYIAYIMPDIFAPVMLILIAAVVGMGREMRLMEYLIALALAAFALVLHPSHLGIVILMLPFAILAALIRLGCGRWLAVGFIAGLVVIGLSERKAFELAAENVAQKDVHYTPHLTARLIEDGPGLSFLGENCPRDDLATCALYEALSLSDDPFRLTVSHILFKRSPELGSFQLMTTDDQVAVAQEQRSFFFTVLADRPLSVLYAFSKNAAGQLLRNSVRMTIPEESTVRNAKSLSGLPEARLAILSDGGVLARDRTWIGTADRIHTVIYLSSFIVVIGLLVWPGRIAPPLKVFALFLLIGVAMNALVCGGVSQPADRYGARVMWLLPFTAAFLILFLPRRKPQPDTGALS